jgi:hypothetical protein
MAKGWSKGRRAPAAIAAAVSLWTPAAALGAHPLVTDDAGTLGAGAWQLELGAERSRDVAGSAGARSRADAGAGALTVGVGLREDLDLAVAATHAWSRTEEPGARTETRGVGDVTADLKWRVLQAGGLGLAVKPGVSLPTGDPEHGLGTGRVCYGVTLIASQELGRVGLHANAGWAHDEYARREDREANRADRVHASVAATLRVTGPLLVVANVGAETNPDRTSDTWPAYGLGGVVFAVREDLDLDAGLKVGLTAPETDLTGLAGVTWRF